MGVLSELEPRAVFSFFEEITQIPHGSGDTKRISDWVVSFAKERGLEYIQDDANNVIIRAAGTPGYENEPAVMLQGHLDMVCEKEPDCDIDFANDGLSLMVKDGQITADGTTLGGDDGIAVAYILAILDDPGIAHPPLECVFTTDEEIGMLGAAAMDMSVLKARRMINIDSEEEGYLLTSCAGGATATCHLPVEREADSRPAMKLSVEGLLGGHSGAEIDKGRAAANEILGRALSEIFTSIKYKLVTLSGGSKENAIARSSSAVLVLDEADQAGAAKITEEFERTVQAEYAPVDPDIRVTLTPFSASSDEKSYDPMTDASTEKVLAMLRLLPQGIMRMSPNIDGLVETSLNLGVMDDSPLEFRAKFATRSSVESEINELHDRLSWLMRTLSGTLEIAGEYPAMEYRADSPLRERMCKVYRKMYGKDIIIYALHAGVECGLFAGRLDGLDAVSIGPDMSDVHTSSETLSIESVARTWDYLLEVLKTRDGDE